MITAPGLYPELSSSYFTENLTPTPYLSQSGIKTLLSETPFDYRNPSKRKSEDMNFGSIVHALALGKGSKFIVAPYDDYRTKDARAWKEEQQHMGLIPIKADKYADAEKIALVIQEKIRVALDGADYETEVPFFWQENEYVGTDRVVYDPTGPGYVGGVTLMGSTWCGGMLDVWCDERSIALDPKITSAVPSPMRAMVNFGWDLQAAWYRRGLESIFPDRAGRIRFANILVKPMEPFTSRLISINEAWRHGAERECLRALRIFQECTRTGVWPGYPDTVEEMDAPSWLLAQRMMEDESGED